MLWGLLLTVVLTGACVGGVWLAFSRAGKETGHAPVRRGTAPETLEGKLTSELVRGEITGRRYQQAMAAVAARDTERNPLDVPPDIAPPGPA